MGGPRCQTRLRNLEPVYSVRKPNLHARAVFVGANGCQKGTGEGDLRSISPNVEFWHETRLS